ncbi:type II toxin-antitoxin system VapC family toxin [Streptomyces europaeiscabiei]|uniref:PIN domain-containing protein n=1 Tax=Streptomyces europaeiscabiei TaxID=146819 RepID=A0ABU4NTN8_9ACTN|nr:PIN domain-containing protein [Streptomyces europaeiscabiei]MDX3555170.1 PIN domain-containing protein [Streptomyces europaeiscabiei]MDX3705184.1 PIN domain-containing protein [Streptomyces europaeiscabiei]MDX3864405.1 PIN domain-containing protein [Streptomyces europaeiscabiei]MDX3871513.1 PIN domain-containing protein [Streptomyces europaeiscabiei]
MARPDHPRSVYLDACCYIDWAEGKHSCAEVVTWLRAAHSGKVKIIASTAMFAEARATGNGRPDPAAEKRIRDLLQEPYVALVDVTRRVGLLSRELGVERPRVKGMDALHLATAIEADAEVFLSRDLKAFSTGELYRGVWIEDPYEFGGEGLFQIPGA